MLLLAAVTLAARVIRFGYFAEAQTHAVGCARGLFHLEGTTDAAGNPVDLEVVCLPQSSGGYAVAKLDRGDLDVAVLGSTPWAMAVSRGVDLSAFYVPHSKGDSQALVTRDTIATPRDLHGKTIATPFGSTAHQHLLVLREIFPGVAFNLINSPPSRAALEPLWTSGAIDGAFCWGDGFVWLKTVGKVLVTARTLGHWGVETFNVVAARREVAASLPGLLPHLAAQLAALDGSFIDGTSDEWLVERADGYLTSVADVITVGNTAPPPSVYDDAARSGALVALRLFELIDATTMAGCEWLGCAASVRGLVAKSSDASSFLYGQKLLARLAPPWHADVGGAFAAATTAAPLLAAENGTLVVLPSGGNATARRGATGQGSTCEGVVELTASDAAQTIGDGAGGVAGRSYSDNLACEWRLAVGAGERIRITFSTLRVWAGDTLTVHAESYKGLVADALVAKLVTAPTGGVTLPALSAAGPLVVRFSTDARSEGFYNAAADGAEDNDGFVASFVRAPPCSGPDDCGGEACDGDGECACAAAGRGGADCSHAHCMGTSVVATPGTLRSHAAYGVGSYDDDAECVFVITASGGGADIRLTVTHDLEATFDFLEVYSGAGTGGVLYARLTGTGTTVVTVPATDGAATLHFTSDAVGRRGGFTVAYVEDGSFASQETDADCAEGRFGMDCAAFECRTQNRPFAAPDGSLAMQSDGAVPPLADCSWALPAGSRRVLVDAFDLEGFSSGPDGADHVTLGDGNVTLWVKRCTADDECGDAAHDGVCGAETGVCGMRAAHDIIDPDGADGSALIVRLQTDRNDPEPHSGVVLRWMPLAACPVAVDAAAPEAQCVQAGGVCEPGWLLLAFGEVPAAWACACGGELDHAARNELIAVVVVAVVIIIVLLIALRSRTRVRRTIKRRRARLNAAEESRAAARGKIRRAVAGVREWPLPGMALVPFDEFASSAKLVSHEELRTRGALKIFDSFEEYKEFAQTPHDGLHLPPVARQERARPQRRALRGGRPRPPRPLHAVHPRRDGALPMDRLREHPAGERAAEARRDPRVALLRGSRALRARDRAGDRARRPPHHRRRRDVRAPRLVPPRDVVAPPSAATRCCTKATAS